MLGLVQGISYVIQVPQPYSMVLNAAEMKAYVRWPVHKVKNLRQ